MGSNCCGTTRSTSTDFKNLLIRLYNIKKIQIFDMTTETYEEAQLETINPPNFIGHSQILVNKTLYLCGTNQESSEFESSSMLSMNPFSLPIKIKHEVSSFFTHYQPTLCAFEGEYIFVLGGKKTEKCELYFIKHQQWKKIPNLPYECYGATALMHVQTYSVYLFGGINTENNSFNERVFKLGLPKCEKWEEIKNIKEDDLSLLKRAFSINCRDLESKYIILGGSNKENENTNDVIEVYIDNDEFFVKKSKIVLPFQSKFQKYSICKVSQKDRMIYSFNDDEEYEVIKVDIINENSTSITIEHDIKGKESTKNYRIYKYNIK